MSNPEKGTLAAAARIADCFRRGGKLLLCGNGGSAADCAHIAGELCKGFLKKRPLPEALCRAIGEPWAGELQGGLPALDLTAAAGLISAIVNDMDGADIYAQQVIAYGRAGDTLLGISTSGNAENVRRALVTGRALDLFTIALTGEDGGRMKAGCDLWLPVPARETYRVQEMHLPLYHRLCIAVEEALFPGS